MGFREDKIRDAQAVRALRARLLTQNRQESLAEQQRQIQLLSQRADEEDLSLSRRHDARISRQQETIGSINDSFLHAQSLTKDLSNAISDPLNSGRWWVL